MQELAPKLFVGNQADFDQLDQFGTQWSVVFAARDPWHRKLLGYTGRGCPSDHPEYLMARRGNRLYLNLFDGDDPKYVNRTMIDAAVAFIHQQRAELSAPDKAEAVLVCCNQGGSRAPTIALLALAREYPEGFDDAVAKFTEAYPLYNPAKGMREFARIHWRHYRRMGGPQEAASQDASDITDAMAEAGAQRLRECRFGEDLASVAKQVYTAMSSARPKET